ncbi:MAG: thiolase family protein [Candidatus Acidiferrales bacterium]|jgi:acetyl-CoA C-acetyltransferase
MTKAVYIVSAARTPIGKFGGALADYTAPDLGVIAVRAALERAFGNPLPPERTPGEPEKNPPPTLPWRVDEVIIGNARPAGVGPNPGRQIAWRAGLGDDVPGFTVNMACASGLRAVALGRQQILTGEAEIIVAGGAESMSRVPYLLEGRWGFKMGNQPLVDAMYRDGFFCQISKMVMGETAELLAKQYKISRTEQDEFALESQRRAARALAECRFLAEIVPIERKDKKGNIIRIEKDEHVRADTTLESLAKLPPVFSKTGTVTAGNSSGITDGAAALVLASEEKVRELGLKPLARIVDATLAAVDPRVMGIGPVPAIRKLTARTGTRLDDYVAIELNEAFAAQVLACDRDLHFQRERLNPNGGAIAIGHPIGCTGARILTTLICELRRDGKTGRRGLATLCVSGGLGMAVEVESV